MSVTGGISYAGIVVVVDRVVTTTTTAYCVVVIGIALRVVVVVVADTSRRAVATSYTRYFACGCACRTWYAPCWHDDSVNIKH